MITNTASEIMKQAKFLAQAKNSDFVEFDSAISLLNNEYLALYNEIVENSRDFVSSFTFSGTKTPLPTDCFKIQSVVTYPGNNVVTAGPLGKDVPGMYYVENNCIYIAGNPTGTYLVKYSTMPASLTIPEEPFLLSNFPSTFTISGIKDDTLFAYDSSGEEVKYYEYDLKTNELLEVDETTYEEDVVEFETTYLGKTFSFDTENQTVTWNDEDVSDSFIAYDDVTGDQLTFTNIVISSPYLMIEYSNGEIYIMNNFSKTKWNILVSKGLDTRGNVIALATDDSTGLGAIVHFSNRKYKGYYLCSFVPDTVLSYPDNTFFQLLEARIALQIRMLLGQDTQELSEVVIPNYEMNFWKSLNKGQAARTNNVLGVY